MTWGRGAAVSGDGRAAGGLSVLGLAFAEMLPVVLSINTPLRAAHDFSADGEQSGAFGHS